MDDMSTAVRQTGVLDFVKTIGNKEYHILSPVIGGLAVKVDEQSIILPVAHLEELAHWLNLMVPKIKVELDKAHKFERGE